MMRMFMKNSKKILLFILLNTILQAVDLDENISYNFPSDATFNINSTSDNNTNGTVELGIITTSVDNQGTLTVNYNTETLQDIGSINFNLKSIEINSSTTSVKNDLYSKKVIVSTSTTLNLLTNKVKIAQSLN